MKNEIRQAIYDKYIAPTKKERPDFIGVEIEMPVVNLSGQAVDEAVSIKTAERFIEHFDFKVSGSDTDGNITSAKDDLTGDILSFDCCYSNLELSSEGLIQRGLGEEALLAPLYERVRLHTNPARTMLDGIKNGIPMSSYIRQYAAI